MIEQLAIAAWVGTLVYAAWFALRYVTISGCRPRLQPENTGPGPSRAGNGSAEPSSSTTVGGPGATMPLEYSPWVDDVTMGALNA